MYLNINFHFSVWHGSISFRKGRRVLTWSLVSLGTYWSCSPISMLMTGCRPSLITIRQSCSTISGLYTHYIQTKRLCAFPRMNKRKQKRLIYLFSVVSRAVWNRRKGVVVTFADGGVIGVKKTHKKNQPSKSNPLPHTGCERLMEWSYVRLLPATEKPSGVSPLTIHRLGFLCKERRSVSCETRNNDTTREGVKRSFESGQNPQAQFCPLCEQF